MMNSSVTRHHWLLCTHTLPVDGSSWRHQLPQTRLQVWWSNHQSRQCHIHHGQCLGATYGEKKLRPTSSISSTSSLVFVAADMHDSSAVVGNCWKSFLSGHIFGHRQNWHWDASSTVCGGGGLKGGPSPCPRAVAHFCTSAGTCLVSLVEVKTFQCTNASGTKTRNTPLSPRLIVARSLMQVSVVTTCDNTCCWKKVVSKVPT